MSTTSEYWVGPTIGQGSFAQVVYAEHKATEKKVAIKVVEQVFLKKQNAAMQGLLNERKILMLLKQHVAEEESFVVNLWASFLDSQCVYLVLELALGGDLAGLIQFGRSTHQLENKWHQSIPYYAWQLIQAIQFLYSHKVVHCDIKPANILCSERGKLLLADFASAIEITTKEHSDEEKKVQTNVPRGTSEFSCPELIKAELSFSSLIAVDLWSVGCVMYAMLQGGSPFHADSESLSVQLIMDYKNNPDSGLHLKGDFSNSNPQLKNIIQDLLSVNPGLRIKAYELMKVSTLWKMSAERPCDLVVPKAKWLQIETAELKDGALGWGAFLV